MLRSSWKKLNTSDLQEWRKKLKAVKNKSPQEQKNQIGEYYQYLIENNYIYGNLAYQASQNDKFTGRFANNYLHTMAEKENVIITHALRQTLMLKLALQDIKARDVTMAMQSHPQ